MNILVEVVVHIQASNELKTSMLGHPELALILDYPSNTPSVLLQTLDDRSLMHRSIIEIRIIYLSGQ